jgi:hypothetical protein
VEKYDGGDCDIVLGRQGVKIRVIEYMRRVSVEPCSKNIVMEAAESPKSSGSRAVQRGGRKDSCRTRHSSR